MTTQRTQTPPKTDRAPSRSGWRPTLAAISGLQAALVLSQAALAGQFLSGDGSAITYHRELGLTLISWTALVSVGVAVLWWKPAGGPAWPILTALLSFLAIGGQIAAGFTDLLVVHIPLGVTIFGLNLWMASRLTGKQWRAS